jgi:hypothetical protein
LNWFLYLGSTTIILVPGYSGSVFYLFFTVLILSKVLGMPIAQSLAISNTGKTYICFKGCKSTKWEETFYQPKATQIKRNLARLFYIEMKILYLIVDRVSLCYPGWSWTLDLPASASWVTGITGRHHHNQLSISL